MGTDPSRHRHNGDAEIIGGIMATRAEGTTTRSTSHVRTPRRPVVHSSETKQAFKTNEFWAYIASVAGVAIASWIVTTGNGNSTGDAFSASRAWMYIAALSIGYMVSRGLAKAGSHEPHDAARDIDR